MFRAFDLHTNFLKKILNSASIIDSNLLLRSALWRFYHFLEDAFEFDEKLCRLHYSGFMFNDSRSSMTCETPSIE